MLETGALVAWRNGEGAARCHRLSSRVTAGLMARASIGAGEKKTGVATPDPRKTELSSVFHTVILALITRNPG